MPVIKRAPSPTHVLEGTRFTSLATPSRGSSDISVWQVDIDPGTPARPHRLTREEVFIVLAGTADVSLDGIGTTAEVGDAIIVPAEVEFGIANAGATPLTLLCYLPAGGQAVVDGTAFTPPWAL